MPTWINGIDGIAVAVGVGLLVQVGVAGDEAPHLRVVGPTPHQRQSRVALRSVAARRAVLVDARAAAGAGDGLPEGREPPPTAQVSECALVLFSLLVSTSLCAFHDWKTVFTNKEPFPYLDIRRA